MMNVFNVENIRKYLKEFGDDSALDIIVHDAIGSTNTWVLDECKAGRSLPFACFSEQQTVGRGRRGKVWLMSPRANIAMSLAWPFFLSPQKLQLLPLTIALAIAEALEGFNLKQVQVKWPNDVYVAGVKIAGVLIETQFQSEERTSEREGNKKGLAVVIGVGLNYDMSDVAQSSSEMSKVVFTDVCSEIAKQAGEMKLASKPERIIVASRLLRNVMYACQDYDKSAERILKVFRQKYDYCQNKLVDVVLDDQSKVTGLAKGITDNAELIVEVNGKLQFFNSADVSVNAGD